LSGPGLCPCRLCHKSGTPCSAPGQDSPTCRGQACAPASSAISPGLLGRRADSPSPVPGGGVWGGVRRSLSSCKRISSLSRLGSLSFSCTPGIGARAQATCARAQAAGARARRGHKRRARGCAGHSGEGHKKRGPVPRPPLGRSCATLGRHAALSCWCTCTRLPVLAGAGLCTCTRWVGLWHAHGCSPATTPAAPGAAPSGSPNWPGPGSASGASGCGVAGRRGPGPPPGPGSGGAAG